MIAVHCAERGVLTCGLGGLDVGGALGKRDPVVMPRVHAPDSGRDRYLGHRIGYRVALWHLLRIAAQQV